jgi:hypothetical protein
MKPPSLIIYVLAFKTRTVARNVNALPVPETAFVPSVVASGGPPGPHPRQSRAAPPPTRPLVGEVFVGACRVGVKQACDSFSTTCAQKAARRTPPPSRPETLAQALLLPSNLEVNPPRETSIS